MQEPGVSIQNKHVRVCMLFSDIPLLSAVFSCFVLIRRLIRVRLPAIRVPGIFQEPCTGAVYPRPENAAQRMMRAGMNPAPTLLWTKPLYSCGPRSAPSNPHHATRAVSSGARPCSGRGPAWFAGLPHPARPRPYPGRFPHSNSLSPGRSSDQ